MNKILRKIVYKLTKKPKFYKHIEKASSLQDLRQIQYNNWCKRYGVYNGSYLPSDPNKLLKKGRTEIKINKEKIRKFRRKHVIQEIDFNANRLTNNKKWWQPDHYHWINLLPNGRKNKKRGFERLDRYAVPCEKHSIPSHLAPLDKEYKELRIDDASKFKK